MKRHICWNLCVKDVDRDDEYVCANTLEDGEDLDQFLNLFVDLSDFGFNCFITCDIYYTQEEKE